MQRSFGRGAGVPSCKADALRRDTAHDLPLRTSNRRLLHQWQVDKEDVMASWLASRYGNERGAIGYIILWALGVPASVLFVIFLLRGCN
jgi:hypothetical protein